MNSTFELDLLRCAVLQPMIREWGNPTARYVFSREGNDVEIYYFSSNDLINAYHFATCGVSLYSKSESSVPYEIYIAINVDTEDASDEEISLLLMNVVEHSYRQDADFEPHKIIPPIDSAPQSWEAKAILIDHPYDLGVTEVAFYDKKIQIYQLLSIYDSEYKCINEAGLSNFYSQFEGVFNGDSQKLSDPNRIRLL